MYYEEKIRHPNKIMPMPKLTELHENGLKIVQVTGSGSAVFALSTNNALLKKVFKKLEDKYEVEIAKVIK